MGIWCDTSSFAWIDDGVIYSIDAPFYQSAGVHGFIRGDYSVRIDKERFSRSDESDGLLSGLCTGAVGFMDESGICNLGSLCFRGDYDFDGSHFCSA